MITIKQIKAARALLDWSQQQLADASGLSLAAINNLERGIGSPRQETIRQIERSLRSAKIEFIGEAGVQLSENAFNLEILDGKQGIITLLEDIYETLAPISGEVLLSGLSEEKWEKEFAAVLEEHVSKRKAAGITHRLLICEGDDKTRIDKESYRWVPKILFYQSPYYVYHNKLALITWQRKIKVIIIENEEIAETFRRQFNQNWESATPLPK